jgi:hypothetical protein
MAMADVQHTSGREMPIFTRTYDLLTWLLPATNHFPRAHRHTVTRRLLDAAFDLRERLEEANLRHGAARLERLALADEALARVRLYLRLATRWGWFSEWQYEHVATMVAEIGRLLGGWQRVTSSYSTSRRDGAFGASCCANIMWID